MCQVALKCHARFTVEHFHRLFDVVPEQHFVLIDGEVLQVIANGTRHTAVVHRLIAVVQSLLAKEPAGGPSQPGVRLRHQTVPVCRSWDPEHYWVIDVQQPWLLVSRAGGWVARALASEAQPRCGCDAASASGLSHGSELLAAHPEEVESFRRGKPDPKLKGNPEPLHSKAPFWEGAWLGMSWVDLVLDQRRRKRSANPWPISFPRCSPTD